jgi:probable HAF family extracellular repeat protein
LVPTGFRPNRLPTSAANGINSKGQIVGFSQDTNRDDSPSVAVLWENGTMTDLNSLIPAKSPLFLMEALSINARGQIAGFGGLSDGEHRGSLLTPCDDDRPDVEDRDYSMIDDSIAATAVSPQ